MRFSGLMLCVFGCCFAAIADAATVEIYDRATGATLPTYMYRGRMYVPGEPGHEYEVRIRNGEGRRVLAVTTVDGVNVVTGQTGATNQAGYVLDPYGFTRIEGWRKSMTRTAAFYFTELRNSYAARTGRPDNVGVIGVAVFGERVRCCDDQDLDRQSFSEREKSESKSADAQAGASAPATAKSSAERAASAPRAEPRLGTGHGRGEYSAAQYTEFERASTTPEQVFAIYYDSRRNLVAQGIIPETRKYAERIPQAFPAGFVPDP